MRKVNLEKVQASLDKVSPKCGRVILPPEVRRIDFWRRSVQPAGSGSRGSGVEQVTSSVWKFSFDNVLHRLPHQLMGCSLRVT